MSALPEHTPAAPAARPAGPRPGLRERKKARTRAAIREHAFRLFREQGYDATTVEQIADAAEVSPSTFFRYFPTKEDVVLQDDLDLLWMEAIREQPPEVGPIAALRAGVHAAFARMGEAEWAQLRETTELDLAVPAVAGAIIGIAMAAWFEVADDLMDYMDQGRLATFADKFERGLALLEAGLPV
jgi:AcrR family transcriptional regulator